jgi:hypothetical protein
MYEMEKDIEKRIIDKLSLWLKDSFELCEMAEIRKSTSVAIVMRALMFSLLLGLVKKGSSKADMLEVMGNNWDILVERRKSHDKG